MVGTRSTPRPTQEDEEDAVTELGRHSRGGARAQSVPRRGGRAATAPVTASTSNQEVENLSLRVQLLEAKLELEKQKKRTADDASLSSRRSTDSSGDDAVPPPISPDTRDASETLRQRSAIDADEYLLLEPPYIEPKERAIRSRQEKNFSPQEPRDYVGGSVGAAHAFIRSCETVFRTQPYIYYYQRDKYMYAVSRFRGPVLNNWPAKERQLSDGGQTWITLRRWILDREQDPHNRSITYALRLFNDKMAEGQKVETYVTHLENAEMEVEMEELTESQKCCLLIAGVTPALRNKLLEQQHIPFKRTELVPLLTRLETGLRSRGERPDRAKPLPQRGERVPQSLPFHGKREDRAIPDWRQGQVAVADNVPQRTAGVEVGKSQIHSPATGPNALRNNCFTCGLPGHWSKTCPKNPRS